MVKKKQIRTLIYVFLDIIDKKAKYEGIFKLGDYLKNLYIIIFRVGGNDQVLKLPVNNTVKIKIDDIKTFFKSTFGHVVK